MSNGLSTEECRVQGARGEPGLVLPHIDHILLNFIGTFRNPHPRLQNMVGVPFCSLAPPPTRCTRSIPDVLRLNVETLSSQVWMESEC